MGKAWKIAHAIQAGARVAIILLQMMGPKEETF